jgi:hypothetical protein
MKMWQIIAFGSFIGVTLSVLFLIKAFPVPPANTIPMGIKVANLCVQDKTKLECVTICSGLRNPQAASACVEEVIYEGTTAEAR